MKKIALPAGIVMMLIAVPLFLAAFLATGATPAIAGQIRAVQCSTAGIPATGSWRPPLQQAYALTSGFGMRFHPIYHAWRQHTGQDLVSQPGPGPVVAAAAGKITGAGVVDGYGNAVIVDHGGGVSTLYGHLASITAAITPGAPVWAGQQLGVEGSTGASTGDHLHFEVRLGDSPIDPVPFMLERGAPLNGQAVAPSTPLGTTTANPGVEGGIGFPLPPPGTPRQDSLATPVLSIPAAVKAGYVGAADRYKVPWTLLAAVGMEETGHGRNNTVSSAGAQGLMQFMPATFASYGVDGNSDGVADIRGDADSIMSAANYLTQAGVSRGGDGGVRRAIFAYNHADWYVNDVLYYAQAYGGGTLLGDPSDCGAGGNGNPNLPPLTNERIKTLLTWAESKVGDPYVFGANGPGAWDCSSFSQAAFAQIGITMARTASPQRDWLAAGNGFRVTYGQEKPGDLIFADTYLGPNQIGHVMIVYDSTKHLTVEAGGSHVGNYDYSRYTAHHIFEIWRVGNLSGAPSTQP
jgi:hypothetical protein